jgi:cyclase
MQTATFESSFFRIEPLAEDVYAAIAIDEDRAPGNAGIVSLGSETLIFDTFLTPRAAQDLRAAAEQLTHQPIGWVVNSHWHGDHVSGNQVFAPPATIISTLKTRQLIAKDVTGQQLTLPQLTFDSQLDLHGSQRTATLLTYGEGHSESDAFLWLPDAGIIFAGDVMVIGRHIWMGHGNPDRWISILDRMVTLGMRAVVPGHGPVGPAEAIQPVQRYLRDVEQLVRDAVQAGKSKAEVEALKIPAAFEQWAGTEYFGRSVSALYDTLSAKNRVLTIPA